VNGTAQVYVRARTPQDADQAVGLIRNQTTSRIVEGNHPIGPGRVEGGGGGAKKKKNTPLGCPG
jgi:hypothetical protein